MEVESGRTMLHLEVEAPNAAPPPNSNVRRTRLIALGSATLLLAGAAALQSGALAARPEPAGATTLVAVGGVPNRARVDAMRAHRTFHPSAEDLAMKAGHFAQDDTMEFTCEELAVSLGLALADAEALFHQHCVGEPNTNRWPWSRRSPTAPRTCSLGYDVEQGVGDSLDAAAKKIMEHAWAADTRQCLEETMADEVVQEHSRRIKVRWPEVVAGASAAQTEDWDGSVAPSVRQRLEASYADIQAWRSQMLNKSATILDERLIFPRNVEDRSVCPEPCIRCTRGHNSLFSEIEDLSFKCILPRNAGPPPLNDLRCDAPVTRNSLEGLFQGQRKTWCDVASWQAFHNQTIALGADRKCGAEAILGPLRHGIEMEQSVYKACESVETGKQTEPLLAQQYQEFVIIDDGIASPAEAAAFRVFMELGMAEGLSDLRMAARGHTLETARGHTLEALAE